MIYKDISLENQIFDWEDWADLGDGNMFFYDVVLSVDIPPFQKGTKFDGASLIIDHSIIEFFNDAEDEEPKSMGRYFCKLTLEPTTKSEK